MTAAHAVQVAIAVITALGAVAGGAAFWQWWSARDERAVGTMQDVLASVSDQLAQVRAELAAERAAREADKRAHSIIVADLYSQLHAARAEASRLRTRLDALTLNPADLDSGRNRNRPRKDPE